MKVIIIAMMMSILALTFYCAYQGVSWLTSGDVGKDIGSFAGDVSDSYNGK